MYTKHEPQDTALDKKAVTWQQPHAGIIIV